MDTFHRELTQTRAALLRTARRRLRNPEWAEDAVSETLLAALERRPDFTEPARLRAWLFGILRHKLTDQLRHRLGEARWMVASEDIDLEGAAPHDAGTRSDPLQRVGERQFLAALSGQLARLPRLHARAFLLRECLGSDTAEVCDELGITAGHLWVLLHRARQRLRQGLAAHRA